MRVTQEDDRVPGKGILMATAVLVVASTIGVLAAYFITDCSSAELARAQRPVLYVEPLPRAVPTAGPGDVPGQVPEDVNQIEQVLFRERAPGLEERAAEHERLRGYGWVDRGAGLVRIPIDRAIELYVQGYQQPQGEP
jgi:hypothetical protein